MLSLALGIGATSAIYSLVDQVLLHSLPVKDPAQLVLVDWNGDQVAYGFGSYNLMSYPICHDLQQQDRVFSGAFCRALLTVNLSTGGDNQADRRGTGLRQLLQHARRERGAGTRPDG